jgi:hypothetical protein
MQKIEGVRVHSCFAKTEIRNLENMSETRFYYTDDPLRKSFKALPEKCVCKKLVTVERASLFLAQGKAFKVYRPGTKKDWSKDLPFQMQEDDIMQVVMPVVRSQTPRVDLVTRADIERAYIDGQEKSVRLIEEIHKMIMEERAKLIVPFQPDPQEGRLLFPFSPDQRTKGGLGN